MLMCAGALARDWDRGQGIAATHFHTAEAASAAPLVVHTPHAGLIYDTQCARAPSVPRSRDRRQRRQKQKMCT